MLLVPVHLDERPCSQSRYDVDPPLSAGRERVARAPGYPLGQEDRQREHHDDLDGFRRKHETDGTEEVERQTSLQGAVAVRRMRWPF